MVFVQREELTDEIGSTEFHGAVRYARTGGLHPARFHAGLARLARAAGARVHDRCPATGLEQTASGFRVATAGGAITARDVIVATNAYADGLLPELRRRVLPIGSFIVTTEPLDAEVLDAVSPRRRMFVDTKSFLFYWRTTPDGRVLFGGRRSLSPASLDEAREFLTASLRRLHPQVARADDHPPVDGQRGAHPRPHAPRRAACAAPGTRRAATGPASPPTPGSVTGSGRPCSARRSLRRSPRSRHRADPAPPGPAGLPSRRRCLVPLAGPGLMA